MRYEELTPIMRWVVYIYLSYYVISYLIRIYETYF